jgi:hypothetical protein
MSIMVSFDCLNVDFSVFGSWRIAWGLVVQVAAWIPIAALAYCIWRRYGTYLRRFVFTGNAAAWMQRIGIAELIVVAISIATTTPASCGAP